jgi:hypothetical protein
MLENTWVAAQAGVFREGLSFAEIVSPYFDYLRITDEKLISEHQFSAPASKKIITELQESECNTESLIW